MLLLLCGDIETCPGPTQTYTGLQDFLTTKGFSVLHQNIRGMEEKKDLVADFLSSNKVNIFSLSETFLSYENFTDVDIGGYSSKYKNRKQISGIIGGYIREGIPYTRRKDLECDNLEMMWLEISFKNYKKFLIAVLYRPPTSSRHQCKNFAETLSNKIETVQNENKETIITGDINCDYANPKSHRDVKSCLRMNGFKQSIKKPTRITENTSTIIDVFLTNSPENVVSTDVITANLSDHEMIGAIRKKCQHKYQPKTIRSRNFRNYNKENAKIEIGNINFDPLFAYTNPTDALNFLKELLVNVANTQAPFATKTMKEKRCPWLNENMKREMHYRDALNGKAQKTKSKENWEVYKRQKNRINNIIKNAKFNYYKNLLK